MRKLFIMALDALLAIGIAFALLFAWAWLEMQAYGIHQDSVVDAVICGIVGPVLAGKIRRWADGT